MSINMTHLPLKINLIIYYIHLFLHSHPLAPRHLMTHFLVLSSSSSLELKPSPNTLKYAFFGPNKYFLMIITNYLDLGQEIQVLASLRENREASSGP